MHLADLHLGKRVNGFSMMEDQEYLLNRILENWTLWTDIKIMFLTAVAILTGKRF